LLDHCLVVSEFLGSTEAEREARVVGAVADKIPFAFYSSRTHPREVTQRAGIHHGRAADRVSVQDLEHAPEPDARAVFLAAVTEGVRRHGPGIGVHPWIVGRVVFEVQKVGANPHCDPCAIRPFDCWPLPDRRIADPSLTLAGPPAYRGREIRSIAVLKHAIGL